MCLMPAPIDRTGLSPCVENRLCAYELHGSITFRGTGFPFRVL